MNLDYLKKHKDFARPMLLAVAATLAVLTALKLWEYHSASAKAQSIIVKAVERDIPEPESVKENLARFTEIANAIKRENLFVPSAPKRHPVSMVDGIMGDEALINGKWYKVGDKISDAEVVAIEPTLVKIKWDGKEKVFAPISAIVADTPRVVPETVHAAEVNEKKEKLKSSDSKQKKVKAVKIASGKDDPLGWMGVELPPHLRKKIMKLWNNASEEEKREGMAEWNSASNEKKREMLAELEAMPEDMGG